jgi:lipopolysaccharide biosynthesis glycosyltransferase
MPWFRLNSQKVFYPDGLGHMVNMFRICATARLFIHEMLPTVDAGIYLDSDVLLLDNIINLWSFFSKFNSAQVMALSAVEFSYGRNYEIPHFGPPGVGLNAGVILMNLTRMRDMSGGGFTGSVR